MTTNDIKESSITNISFFWYWIYPLILCLFWGFLLSIIFLLFNKSLSPDFILTMIIWEVILWILFETPFNLIISGIIWGLIYNVFRAANVGFVVLPIKLLVEIIYFIFIWPITLIDKIVSLFIHHNRYTIGKWSLRVAAIEFNEWRLHTNSNYRLLFSSLFISDETRFQAMDL